MLPNSFLPLISIVMPNYNGKRFVAYAIESVLSQTYGNFELIVVDDCSTDNSKDIVKEYSEKDKRIRIIEFKDNQGVAVARNAGISEAVGEYIALLDNDDTWEPDKLERQLKIASAGADIIYCSYDFIDESGNKIKRPFIVPSKTDYKKMLYSSVIGCSTCLVKAELLKQHPFRTDFYHEDYVLWMELLIDQKKALGDTNVLMHYRKVSSSRSDNKINAAKERWNIYRNALNLNLFSSACAFVGYTVNGVVKHYL